MTDAAPPIAGETRGPPPPAPSAPPPPAPSSAARLSSPPDGSYLVPLVHAHVPARAVEWGFWGVLAGATVLGAIDPTLALLIGAGVVVARHRRR